MENMDNLNWEDFSPTPADPGELQKIKKSIRKRHWLTVLTSVLLVAVLIFGAVQYGIPALESRYWDPTECTYLEGIPDLELSIVTFSELFGLGEQVFSVDITKTGFAEYTVDTTFLNWNTMRRLDELSHRKGDIIKSESNFAETFWYSGREYGIFTYPKKGNKNRESAWLRDTRKELTQLPEYVDVLASVSFSEYLTMGQLLDIDNQYDLSKINFLWAALQTKKGEPDYPQCGVHLHQYNTDRYDPAAWTDTDYPRLFLDSKLGGSGTQLEQHVISMLRFSDAQVKNGTGILPYGANESYYEDTLAFMEENGVKSYGCIVIATPAYLLKMLDEGIISDVWVQDVWIGF